MDGFSKDNYIIDQDYFSNYLYRTIPSSRNGCGWIAAYNMHHYLNHKKSFTEVLKEMDEMHKLRVPGPTTMNNMRDYLKKHFNNVIETVGIVDTLSKAKECNCGILRYNENGMPHFISFIRAEKMYRFFNVADGLEDFTEDMDIFFNNHVQKFTYTAGFFI